MEYKDEKRGPFYDCFENRADKHIIGIEVVGYIYI